MTHQIKTEVTETSLKITSPYNPKVIEAFRSRGGKWDGTSWVFLNGSVKNGLAAVKELFGISDETVTIRVAAADDGTEYMRNDEAVARGFAEPRPGFAPNVAGMVQVRPAAPGWRNDQYIAIGGYVLASRRGRDNHAEILETLTTGKIPSCGGSVKNPNVNASDDCVFELEVRKDWAIANGFFTSDEREALRTERAALVARLAEIDAKLTAL